jgi:hypothetical protein
MAGLVNARMTKAPVDPAMLQPKAAGANMLSGDSIHQIGGSSGAAKNTGIAPPAMNVTGDPNLHAPVDPAMSVTGDPRSGMAPRAPVDPAVAGGAAAAAAPTAPIGDPRPPITAQAPVDPAAPNVTGKGGGIVNVARGKPVAATAAANEPEIGARTMVEDNAVKDPVMHEASQIASTQGAVDPTTMTVQGQLEKLLASDNPLMDQARQKAMREANSRGLVNSTMAAQAGEEAFISQALPIAQQDASTFYSQGRANQDSTNQFSMADKNFENTQNLADFQSQASRAQQAEGANQHLNEMEQNYQNSNSMFERDNALKEKLTNAQISSNEKIAEQQRAAASEAAHAQVELGRLQIAAQQTMQQQDIQFRTQAMNLDSDTRMQIAQLGSDTQLQSNMLNLQQGTLVNFGNQMSGIMTSQMEPGDRQNAINNLVSLYGGSGNFLPTGINWDAFHPGGAPAPGGGGGNGTTHDNGGGG